MEKVPPKREFNFIYVVLLIWVVIFAHDWFQLKSRGTEIPYSQFLEELEKQNISEAKVFPHEVQGIFKKSAFEKKEFFVQRIEDPRLAEKLQAAQVKFTAIPQNSLWRDILSWILPALLFIAFWWFIMSRFGQMSRSNFLSLGKNKAKVFVEKALSTRFGDVAGVDEAKAELHEIVEFLRDPKKYGRLGGRMPKGVLLVGPPGTGKTLLARAVAGEAGVPFFSINGSEFVELFVGLGAARVRDLFEQARLQAPCIIFIDELDALGKSRGLSAISGNANDEKEQTLNQLLAELDGFDSSQGIIIIGATNRPEVLDPALLRAGRFDRQILVDKPDRTGREAILKVHVQKVRLSSNVSLQTVASLTAGFSGADLANLVNESALAATRREAEFIEMRDFTESIERIVGGLERKSRILRPEEKKRVAYHEMGHTAVALALEKFEAVHKVSIIPRSIGALGYTFKRPTEDRYLISKEELKWKMAVLLGGRAAEVIFFDDISTGAADDLDKATEIARAMITRFGMSPQLGLATYEKEASPYLHLSAVPNHEHSEATSQLIDNEVRQLLNEAHERAKSLVKEFKDFLDDGAALLLKQETLSEEEIKTLWDKYKGLDHLRVVG